MLPKFVSSESADIIRNVLNTDPASRFGIEEIRKHEWTRKYKRNYEIPPGIVVGYNRIPVDPLILN
jgi:5'-AMP-activated protein kinase catalytic alpha subunit